MTAPTEEPRGIVEALATIGLTPESRIKGVEVGTLRGKTAAQLLGIYPRLTLMCVDSWETHALRPLVDESPAEIEAAARAAIRPYSPRGFIFKDTSLQAAAASPRDRFDFVYLDAGHTAPEVFADMAAWWPTVKPGGLLMGHDYGRRGPNGKDYGWGVEAAVKDWLAGSEGLTLDFCRWTTWAIRKPTA